MIKRRTDGGRDRKDRHGCSLHYPRSVAPTPEAVDRLTDAVRAAAGRAFGSVEVVQTPDPDTKEPMWIGVVWLECRGGDAAQVRRKVLQAVHGTYPGEWFGRLVVQVRPADEGF